METDRKFAVSFVCNFQSVYVCDLPPSRTRDGAELARFYAPGIGWKGETKRGRKQRRNRGKGNVTD